MTETELDQMTSEMAAESNRLGAAIGQVFVDANASTEVGVITLAMSIGHAMRGLSTSDDLEANVEVIKQTILRVARQQPVSGVQIN